MNVPDLAKRRIVMRRSIVLGHCICDPRMTCPCEEFNLHDICHCAGERVAGGGGDAPVRLTAHVRNPGCASKIDKSLLQQVLAGLPEADDPRVLVGASCGDDAGVILLDGDGQTATILTVDVFAPVVDDPYRFGQIAAANSLSDIYAMGGVPQAALSIIGFPVDVLPAAVMGEILRGGADKMKEAGVTIIGGHSINDHEPKCGFAVVGTCRKGGFVRNAGACPGDAIVLTKPLGAGIMAFGHQIGRVDNAALAPVAESMAALNRTAGELMVRYGVHAATDVTGFGLLAHMAEIVRHSGASGVAVELGFAAIPLFAGVAELAAGEVLPGGCERNREAVDEGMVDLSDLSPGEAGILFGPETSGGILAFMPAETAEMFVHALHERGEGAARVIGKVRGEASGGRIKVVRSGGAARRTNNVEVAIMAEKTEVSETTACCCSSPSEAAATRAGLPSASADRALRAYQAAVNAPGVLGVKQKKLISLALSIVCKCEPCVKLNAKAAREAGASDAEIAEAAALGIAFGGSSAMMFYNEFRGG